VILLVVQAIHLQPLEVSKNILSRRIASNSAIRKENACMTGNESSHSLGGNSQLVLTAQLYKTITTMQHIDEVFSWLAQALVYAFDIEVAQCWALQENYNNQHFMQLRSMAKKSSPLPVVNNQVAAIVGQLQNAYTSILQKEVERIFPPYQAKLLARYGLSYCTCYFHRNAALFLPVAQGSTDQAIPAALNVTILLFSRHAHPEQMLASVNLICERAMQAANNRGFLLPAGPILARRSQNTSVQPSGPLTKLNIARLIPHRLEDDTLLKSSSPFASTAPISDKSARRLYSAIDGNKNIGELQSGLHMDMKEFSHALNFLLSQRRVQMFEPGGQAVDSTWFLQA
jgi:hypothetical protein